MLEFKSKNGRTFFMEEKKKHLFQYLLMVILSPGGDFISSSNDHGMSFGGFYHLLEGKNQLKKINFIPWRQLIN